VREGKKINANHSGGMESSGGEWVTGCGRNMGRKKQR